MFPAVVTSFPKGRASRAGRVLVCVALTLVALVGVPTGPDAAAERSSPTKSTGPVLYPWGVGADLGPTPTTLGVRPFAGDDPSGLETGSTQGRAYWKTNHAAGTDYLAFDLDQDFVAHLSSTDVAVSITYLDAGHGAIGLWYDAKDNAEASVEPIPLTNTGRWRTGTFLLADVAFADRLGDTDLRLSGAYEGTVVDIALAAIRVNGVGARVELAGTPSGVNLTPRAGDNPSGLVTGVHDGRGFWRTNRDAPEPRTLYLYMNVADTYAYDTRNTVLVTVDYLDADNGAMRVQYDSPGDELDEMFKDSEPISYGDSRTWKTHTFRLDDAILSNRSNGADFRLASAHPSAELTVAAVRVTVVTSDLDPTEGLRNLLEEATRTLRAAREGDRDGQYPPGSKAVLAAAIADARAVLDEPEPSEARVKSAAHALFDRLEAFRDAAVDTNLARGTAVTASSNAASAPAVVDGDAATAWTSGPGGTGEWLRIDLGEVRPINEVRVAFGTPSSPDYEVAVSTDGTTFDSVGRNGAAGYVVPTRFPTTVARFVRINLDGYADQADTVTVREVEVRHLSIPEPNPRLVRTLHPTDDRVVADFDVSTYGADPTGERDSTRAIQDALYDCYDAGGGTVWLPAGTYRVTDTLEVHAFCTLRGDRRDPDKGRGTYGTVVVADLPPGDDGPVLFRIGGSAGVMGVTTYYPHQDAADPVPYNYTFEIPGLAWIGNENYMMSTVSDVTMLNSYRGIGVSTMANDRGGSPSSGQVHESATIRNVKGTVLYEGVRAYNGADVGTWENVRFSNAYWAQASRAYDPPARAALDAWTRVHGTGLILGDLEWEQLSHIDVADYRIGIRIVPGQRIRFAGSFVQPSVRRTDVALQVDDIDPRWGLTVAGGILEGSEYAIRNDAEGYVKVTGTTLAGDTEGTVHLLDGRPPAYEPGPPPDRPRAALYDVTKPPFEAPRGVGFIPTQDATASIQRALDQAHADGGGIVYLPAGWYRVAGHLRVPAKVELRGASAGPNRDQLGASGGTVLLAYEGRGTSRPDTAPALLALDGRRAGVRGLRVFYPENNPAGPDGLVPYPYAIRGKGQRTYVVNVGLPNAWNGIDLATHPNDRFVLRKVNGAFFDHAVTVGESERGRIEGLLSNGNAVTRVGFGLPGWADERDIFAQVIDKYMRTQATLVTVEGARRLHLVHAFAYGFHDGLVVRSGDVTGWNLGTDNLGEDGHTVDVTTGEVTLTNVLRYNGSTLTGPARLFNVMAIGMVTHAVDVTADPPNGGTVLLTGNEAEPGWYERGAEITVSARPAKGFTFSHWSVDGEVVGGARTLSLTVEDDHTVTAHFAPRR